MDYKGNGHTKTLIYQGEEIWKEECFSYYILLYYNGKRKENEIREK